MRQIYEYLKPWLVFSLLILGVAIAKAQFSGGGGGVSQAYVDNAVATIMAAMPQPATTTPPTDTTVGAVGSLTTKFMLADAVRPARYRSASCTLSAGACNVTWSTPFVGTPNPIGDPSVVNSNVASVMIQCQWTALTTTGGTINCKAPSISLSIVLGALTLFPNAANGLVASGTAIQPL